MSLLLGTIPATTVELVERRATTTPGMVAPNEVLINGVAVCVEADSLYVSAGSANAPTKVSLTLIVDSLSIRREEEDVD